MAYTTSTASSPTALLQALVTFLNAQGWTTEAAAVDGSGYRAHMSKSGLYANFRAAENESIWSASAGAGYGLGMYLGDGYSGAAAWNAQSGGPELSSVMYGCGMLLPAGPYVAHHFHADGSDNIFVAVEHTGGIFGYMGFGPKLSQETHDETLPYFFGSTSAYHNTDTSGATQNHGNLLVSGTEPFAAHEDNNTTQRATGFVQVPSSIQSAANNWISNGRGTSPTDTGDLGVLLGVPFHSIRSNGSDGAIENEFPRWGLVVNHDRAVATSYPRALLMPPSLFGPDSGSGRWIYLGYAPSVYGCDAVGNGWSAGEVLTVGGLDYKVYPRCAARYIP